MLKVIIQKELKRVFTDRRLVFSAFLLPALSIFIMYSLIGKMASSFESDIVSHTSSVLMLHTPASFTEYLESNGEDVRIDIITENMSEEEGKEDLKTGDLDLILAFDPDFDSKVQDYLSQDSLPEIKTYYNPSEEYSTQARNSIVYGLLGGYQEALLTERFGNIDTAKAFGIDTTNKDAVVMDDSRAIANGLSMIMPLLLAILLFAGAMGIGMDTIAGEKERGTMATLLLTPVPRRTLALGKTISLGIIALISAMITFTAVAASLPNMGQLVENGSSGLSGLAFTPLQYIQLIVIMVTLAGIYVGVICLLSVMARSVKEAGTYIGPIYMIVMISSITSMFRSGDIAMVYFAIPVYSSIISIKKLLLYELTLRQFVLSTAVSCMVIAVLVLLITRAFNSEKTMFNT